MVVLEVRQSIVRAVVAFQNNYNPQNYVQGLCPQIGQQCGIKNKAAIAFQCTLNGRLIAALLFILYMY